MSDGLQPLEGGWSGETFSAEFDGERVVVRIYASRSVSRGPRAPEVDAAVLRLVRGLLPVPDVLEVRPGDSDADVPGLLVTSVLPGERLELLLPRLDDAGLVRVGANLGVTLGRLGHVAMPRAGMFRDPTLTLDPVPAELRDVTAAVRHLGGRLPLERGGRERLEQAAEDAQALLDTAPAPGPRFCLVHSDFNPKNLLVDPETLEITGVLDWEFAHAGSPYADLGNLLRFERRPAMIDAVLAAYADFMPAAPADLLARAAAADLPALVELASRAGENPVADAALEKVLASAVAPPGGPCDRRRRTLG